MRRKRTLLFIKLRNFTMAESKSGKNGTAADYYTLESLVFALKYEHLPYNFYKQIAIAENVPLIKFHDKKKLLAYLNGEGTLENIDGNSSEEVPVAGKTLVAKEQCLGKEDPLSLLREYNVNLKLEEIEETDDQIIFGEHSFPKTTKTKYLVYRSVKHAAPKESKEYYSLESLLFLLKTADLYHPMYLEEARKEGIPPVKIPDRYKVLAYLCGVYDTSVRIDTDTSTEAPVTEKSDDPKEQNEQDQDPIAKKPRLEQPQGFWRKGSWKEVKLLE